MLTEYNSQDAERLQQARLARFRAFVLTDFEIVVGGDRLLLKGADPTIAITQANTLLYQAAIILGTSRLKIYADNNLVFAAELKSEQILVREKAMATATAARSVEFDINPTQTQEMLDVIPWSRITNITGETEQELRSRLQASGTPFYWSDDGWAVNSETASQLIIRFRFEQGRKEVAMLLGETTQEGSQTNGHIATPKSKSVRTDSGGASKPEFQPLKKGVTPTLEKYLDFVNKDAARQAEILADIAQENTKGKRHLTKIVNSYPPDIKKPTRGEFQVAAQKLMAKRTKQLKSETEAEAETTATEEASEAI
ncbi:MAG: hypothetical protein KME52_18360 [Desmonostoc geniculatum HA4340-LM1]|jgi:uncharacterized membrane-anchored protein YhcB (DUF1043 family)|nr:hypothetical protein [Desmonostoc geniculatum HA4340-LM1]